MSARVCLNASGRMVWLVIWLLAAGQWNGRTACAQVGGVSIDPDGMLREASTLDRGKWQDLLRAESIELARSSEVRDASGLRKVSLRRLESAVAEARGDARPLPPEIRCLAGLYEVRYVFFYPEQGDVVLAGPAEGWEQSPQGEFIGVRSRWPVMHLDDLIVALRYAWAAEPVDGFIGCSIDPTEKGIEEHAKFIARIKRVSPEQAANLGQALEKVIGPHDIKVFGVPGSSRFALEMVAADYRLKRLALGHDPTPVDSVRSYIDLAARHESAGLKQQHRWWFVGHLEAIRYSPDRLAWELEGPGLRVETAPVGNRPQTRNDPDGPRPSRAAALFAESATRGFEKLAEKIPAFAELKNLVALSLAAELIRNRVEEFETQGASPGWQPTLFLDNEQCPIARYEVPTKAPAISNVRRIRERQWLFSVSGGVEINPQALVGADRQKPAEVPESAEVRARCAPPADGTRWWWD